MQQARSGKAKLQRSVKPGDALEATEKSFRLISNMKKDRFSRKMALNGLFVVFL
jgi:hypothetical protein